MSSEKTTDLGKLAMNVTKALENIGLNEKQAKVYLACLELDSTTVNKISKKNPRYSLVKFQRSIAPYEISPHCDAEVKLVTYMIYMPTEGSPTDMGTNICVPIHKEDLDPNRSKKCTHSHKPWSEFKTIKQVAYTRNTLFAFAKCSNSWHSVKMKENYPARTILRGLVLDGA